jgi:hypothetical protein
VYEQLSLSPLFIPEERDYLISGLQAYWKGDHLKTSLVFIPYLENLFRRLIRNSNGITLKQNRRGGYNCLSLNDLIEDPVINNIFGIEVSFYFKVLLTDPFGWNLRNDFAHGIGINSFFRGDIANRLFHVLLLLSMVRSAEEKEMENG